MVIATFAAKMEEAWSSKQALIEPAGSVLYISESAISLLIVADWNIRDDY